MFYFINDYLVFLEGSFIFRTHLGQPWDKVGLNNTLTHQHTGVQDILKYV